MAQDVMQEYVVKLGTVIDNEGVNRILSFLDSSKVKALGLAGALAGVTTAVYKFIESATAHEFELEKLAKKQKKSIELVRAENNAMKAMGKTMAEINKDKDLKAVYKDIVEFNKEMQMPNMDVALDKVRSLEVAFTKLKSVINTASQWINAQVLINLERPLDRITGKTQGFADWLKENMKTYAPKIATILTDFARGIMGIVEAGGKVLQWLNELPQAIKNVLVIVGALIALIKGGTIGRLLVLIGLIGDILHDKDVYDWNKANGGNVPTLSEIWDIWYDEDLDPTGKAKAIATKIVEILNRNIKDAFKDFSMSEIFGDGKIGGQGFFSDVLTWLKENQSLLEEFGKNLVTVISGGVRAGGGIVGGAAGMLMNAIFGDDTMDQYIFSDEDGSAAATWAGALGGFIYDFSEAMKKNDGNIFKSFKAGMKGATIGGILTSAIANITQDENGKLTINWDKIEIDLSTLANSVLNLFEKAIKTTRDFGSLLFERIGKAIGDLNLGNEDLNAFGTSIGNVFKKWSSNQTLMSGLSTSITAALTGANFWESILTGVVGSFVGGKSEAREQMQKYLGENSGIPWDVILGLDDESLEKEFKRFGGEGTFLTKTLGNFGEAGADFIEGIVDVLLEGAKGVAGLSQTLWGKIVEVIGNALSVDMSGSGDSIFGGMITTAGATAALGGNFIQVILASLTTGLADLTEKYNGDLGTGIKEEAKKFWTQIKLLWYGELDDKGNWTGTEGKGLRSFFKDLFEGENGESGIKAFFDGLARDISVWLQPVGEAIINWANGVLEQIWINLYNRIIEGSVLESLFPDPNKSTISEKNGKYTAKDTHGREYELTPEQAKFFMANENGQWDTSGNGMYSFAVDKDGNIYGTGNMDWMDSSFLGRHAGEKGAVIMGQEANEEQFYGLTHYQDTTKTPERSAEWEEREKREYEWNNQNFEAQQRALEDGGSISVEDVDFEQLQSSMNELSSEASNTADEGISPLGDAAGGVADTLQDVSESISSVPAAIQNAINAINKAAALAGKRGTEKAWGGRIGSEGVYTVGEDGPEYIIPITKRERAMDLINQMFSEMGMGALNRASGDFGIGSSASFGTLGGSLDSLINGLGGNTNISAPINIYVTATGADGEEIGAAAYNAAERHLVKTLRGVCA